MTALDHLDMTKKLSKKEYNKRLKKLQKRLLLQRLVLGGIFDGSGTLGPPVCILFEGWDASGKGGAIKRLVEPIDPRHVRVASFAAPTSDEKRHHFMLRFTDKMPGWGGMAVLDRSWYGRVLVERVEGFCTEDEWRRSYSEIRGFERAFAAEGAVIIKFWMHITHEEQLARFEGRKTDPMRNWKLTEEDWRNREKRGEYEEAVIEMLERTDSSFAPWIIVEANDKKYARIKVLETVVDRIDLALKERGIDMKEIEEQVKLKR